MNAKKSPETLLEAVQFFASEENCHNYMVNMRWPDGVISCPMCGSGRVGKLVVSTRFVPAKTSEKTGKVSKERYLTRRVWNCGGCRKQFSVKVGTIFEDSPLGLDKWLPALWLVINAKNGVSSYEIHRSLGVTQKTAWFMGHRIRLALHEGDTPMMDARAGKDGDRFHAVSKTVIGRRLTYKRLTGKV